MMNENALGVSTSDLAFGCAGFIVLDIVESERGKASIHLHLGGTAGNVAVILGALGWESFPFARLPQNDAAFAILAKDLRRFGVHLDYVSLAPAAPLPALVQRKRADGSEQPLFTSRCPRCNSRWRNWSPITRKAAAELLGRLPCFRFFLIDRCSPGNLALASRAKEQGALIIFEPTSLKTKSKAETGRLQEALAMADIVKYSAQRLAEVSDKDFPRAPALEIQTLDSEGLRFRWRLGDGAMAGWKKLAAACSPHVQDPCGAGDWLTAVLLHLVGQSELASLTEQQLREALTACQAAAAWACQFMGARGGMYGGDGKSLEEYVFQQTGKRYPLTTTAAGPPISRDTTLHEAMREFCPNCRGDWLPAVSTAAAGDVHQWQDFGRPGYVGRQAAARRAELVRKYGPDNWRIVYSWRGKTITREEALEIYVNAYEAHFRRNPDVLRWLVKTASNVYDIAPSDIESGTDFTIQKSAATHLQDIAVRIALQRLGRSFEGTELIQIRGKSSPGHMLSPGVVPFHQPQAIDEPELQGWWRPGTIESFWQSNKRLEVRPWDLRLFVFGGSFNPIHNAHLELARHARDVWGFDRVIFVPNGDNYKKKTLAAAPAEVRLEMVAAAIEGEAGMEALDVEVYDKTAVRTPVAMKELSQRHPRSQLALFRGLDSLHRIHRDCFAVPKLTVLTIARKGCNLTLEKVFSARGAKLTAVRDRICFVEDAVVDDLSSTQIRKAVRQGRSISHWVPAAVEKIVRDWGLYVDG